MRTTLALIGILLAAGCARRAHLRDDFGVATRTFFDRQAVAAASGAGQGLDSEEAAAIHQRYRETVGKKGVAAPRNDPRSSVLILGEDRHDAIKAK